MTERILPHEIHRQDTGYYCGPASCRTALSARGVVIAESTLAGQLRTTINGTDSSTYIANVLNGYVGNVYSVTWIGGQSATQSQKDALKRDLLRSINGGYVIVANITGSVRALNGATYSYGGHYVPVVGYRAGGDEALVSDVAFGGEYWLTTSALADWIAGRGYSHTPNVAASAASARKVPDMFFAQVEGSPVIYACNGVHGRALTGDALPGFQALKAAGVPHIVVANSAQLNAIAGPTHMADCPSAVAAPASPAACNAPSAAEVAKAVVAEIAS